MYEFVNSTSDIIRIVNFNGRNFNNEYLKKSYNTYPTIPQLPPIPEHVLPPLPQLPPALATQQVQFPPPPTPHVPLPQNDANLSPTDSFNLLFPTEVPELKLETFGDTYRVEIDDQRYNLQWNPPRPDDRERNCDLAAGESFKYVGVDYKGNIMFKLRDTALRDEYKDALKPNFVNEEGSIFCTGHDEKVFIGPVDRVDFSIKFNHTASVHPRFFNCSKCNHIAKTPSMFIRHFNSAHYPKSYVCFYCQSGFGRDSQARTHMKTCRFRGCNKLFGNN